MPHQQLFERTRQLIDVEIESMKLQLEDRFSAIKAKNNAAGRLQSGATLRALHEAASDDLAERSKIILEAFKRTHSAFMPLARSGSREEAKTLLLKGRCQL